MLLRKTAEKAVKVGLGLTGVPLKSETEGEIAKDIKRIAEALELIAEQLVKNQGRLP